MAHLAPSPDHLAPLTTVDVEAALDRLRHGGFRAVVTGALHPLDRRPFLDAGFAETRRLHLLRHDLAHLRSAATVPGIELHRGRRRERPAALVVDRAAFAPFWRLDEAGLAEALTATPMVHFQVARDQDGVIGYAVCGCAGHRGYVQRLAVAPERQGLGVGTALLGDGLHWLRRRGARDALVNTQEDNARSLRLYQHTGFVLEPEGLSMLERSLVGDESEPPQAVTPRRPREPR
ncbi:MAG TPA: GNAT family N-acetyltransferase [Acidimicrobiales bacterium]|nr:GNAT family N-acetyltransferase [Acidimicrobiales bacterium]